MAEIIMPKAGDAMTEGKVVRWYKQPGDAVKRGEAVAEIETDKVNLDLEAEADGTLGEHAAKEGDMVPVGNVLARILAEGEKEEAKPAAKEEPKADADAAPKAEPKAEAEDEQPAKEEPEAEPTQSESLARRGTDKKDSVKHTTGEYPEAIEHKGPRRDRSGPEPAGKAERTESGDRKRSSPLARRIARELGVSLDDVQGSGPKGRIVADAIKNAQGSGGAPAAAAAAPEKPAQKPSDQTSQPAAPPQEMRAPVAAGVPVLETKIIPLTAMRRTIAKRLSESLGPIPTFYLTADYDVTNLMTVRQQLIEISGVKVSVNDFIIRAIALALRHHPTVNASWGEEAITQHGDVHVGVAVATPDGLITPVIRNADTKAVTDIATEVRALADKAKNRRLKPDEYQGSTFTISNLGAWGIEEFTAIINPPNAAILAIGAAEARAIVDANRQVVVRDRMKVTMSCDHRVVDGATGADFLKTLRQYIEQPLRLVV
ncbi:MAG TPA: dihydrolipoamide acetyltransferase family protein [Thermoanaerobaculia bacterium]|nr:dihydrolipoamide acetyltransferase family protein [Thermoanaerobaculia bacterium]